MEIVTDVLLLDCILLLASRSLLVECTDGGRRTENANGIATCKWPHILGLELGQPSLQINLFIYKISNTEYTFPLSYSDSSQTDGKANGNWNLDLNILTNQTDDIFIPSHFPAFCIFSRLRVPWDLNILASIKCEICVLKVFLRWSDSLHTNDKITLHCYSLHVSAYFSK